MPTGFLGDLRVFYQNRYRPRIGMITLFRDHHLHSVPMVGYGAGSYTLPGEKIGTLYADQR